MAKDFRRAEDCEISAYSSYRGVQKARGLASSQRKAHAEIAATKRQLQWLFIRSD